MQKQTEYTQLGVRIEKTMHDQLVAIAEKEHRTVSQVVRIALIYAIEMQKTFDAMPNAKACIDEKISKI